MGANQDDGNSTVPIAVAAVALGPRAFAFPLEQADAARFAARYQAGAEIGRGGMGQVQLFTDHTLGRVVVLKSIRTDLSTSSTLQHRFVREARVQGQLDHPGIPPVYDLGIAPDGQFFFTMKHVQGVTLASVIERLAAGTADATAKYTRRKLLDAFASLCHAVDYAHQRRIVHRDLKPANVMLGEFGETYVLDWGIAKLADDAADTLPPLGDNANADATATGAIMGTPRYMAPEQATHGAGAAAATSDVYALGAILFEILAWAPLCRDGAAFAAPLDDETRAPSTRRPAADIPPELDAICQRATALDPGQRPTARELGEALARFLDGERDDDLRRRLADQHAKRATDILTAGQTATSDGELGTRRAALREIGRALALEHDHAAASAALVGVMERPPRELPAEVTEEVEHGAVAQRRSTASIAVLAYVSLFAYIPVLLWAGIRDRVAVAFLFSAFAASAVTAAWTRRTGRMRGVMITLVLSNIAFASISLLFGALLVVPAGVAVNTVAFAIVLDRPRRLAAMAIGCAAIIAPFLLETIGVVGPSYVFGNRVMTVVPRAVELEAVPTLVILLLASIGTMITSAVSIGRLRDALSDAERRLYLYNWHVRQFAPGSAQPVTREHAV